MRSSNGVIIAHGVFEGLAWRGLERSIAWVIAEALSKRDCGSVAGLVRATGALEVCSVVWPRAVGTQGSIVLRVEDRHL